MEGDEGKKDTMSKNKKQPKHNNGNIGMPGALSVYTGSLQ